MRPLAALADDLPGRERADDFPEVAFMGGVSLDLCAVPSVFERRRCGGLFCFEDGRLWCKGAAIELLRLIGGISEPEGGCVGFQAKPVRGGQIGRPLRMWLVMTTV